MPSHAAYRHSSQQSIVGRIDMRRMSKPPALRVFTLRTDTAWVGEGFPLGEVPF
jgi:hypothetical protein